jgi:hypothetical protein
MFDWLARGAGRETAHPLLLAQLAGDGALIL